MQFLLVVFTIKKSNLFLYFAIFNSILVGFKSLKNEMKLMCCAMYLAVAAIHIHSHIYINWLCSTIRFFVLNQKANRKHVFPLFWPYLDCNWNWGGGRLVTGKNHVGFCNIRVTDTSVWCCLTSNKLTHFEEIKYLHYTSDFTHSIVQFDVLLIRSKKNFIHSKFLLLQ